MSDVFKTYRDNAYLAQASYINFADVPYGDQNALAADLIAGTGNESDAFAQTQAKQFTDLSTGYTLRGFQPDFIFDSGFSASLFESNEHPGQFTLAIRGTEPIAGFFNDFLNADILGIALSGKAQEQAISAYRYYKQLVTPQGAAVQYSASEILELAGLRVGTFNPLLSLVEVAQLVSQLSSDRGIGTLLNPDGSIRPINITGHSLGGHLAILLASMLPASSVNQIYTYNAPGTGGIASEVLKLLGINLADTAIANKITNLIGEGGLNVASEIGFVPGGRQNVFIEKQALDQIANHSIVKLSDSLAVYNLFATMDSRLNTDPNAIATITGILNATSNVAANTLELVVSSLGRLFSVSDTTFTGNEFDTNRDLLYTSLDNIKTALPPAGSFQLISLADLNSTNYAMVVNAALGKTPDGLAYRYALFQGIPFVVLNFDYSQQNTLHQLDLYNPDTGEGNLSKEYLTDRAAYLSWQFTYNKVDRDYSANSLGSHGFAPSANVWFEDHSSGSTINLYTAGESNKDSARKIIFGNNFSADTLTGSAQDDRI